MLVVESSPNLTTFALECVDQGDTGVCDPWRQRQQAYPRQLTRWHSGNGTVNVTNGNESAGGRGRAGKWQREKEREGV